MAAGQWVHLAFHHGGSFGNLPNWHAFSIASAPEDDFLEFHIGVQGCARMIDHNSDVVVKIIDQNFAKISRRGNWLEWILPHRVPHSGGEGRTPCFGTTFNAKSDNAPYLHLRPSGRNDDREEQPQPP